jgi:hypothetical protein
MDLKKKSSLRTLHQFDRHIDAVHSCGTEYETKWGKSLKKRTF